LFNFENHLKKQIIDSIKALEGIKKAKEERLWGALFWITICIGLTIKNVLILPFIGRIFGWW
jgi:hypothetical protein